MGKKAPRRNAYFMFMLDYKRREESRGRRFSVGLQEVSKLASDAWKILPQEEKDLYKKKADDYNKSEERSQGWSGPLHKKKNKNPPPPPNRALTIKEEKQRNEKLFIQNLVENMTINDLLDHVFYLIHVNVFCKTLKEEYVPAEIAISKFSLREGVTDVFHRILNPGQTPLGYSYEIMQHSEKTHRIPLDFVKATRGYLGIYKGITDFLRQRGDASRVSPIYTMFDEPFHNCSMSAVKYTLKGIWETSNIDDDDEDDGIDDDDKYEKTFKVLSLPILFFHLKNKCISTFDDDTVAFVNTSEANIELLNDKYEFNEELACQFHKEIDNVRYCSQSYTVRWAQVIREHCLKNFDSDEEEEEAPIEDEDERIKRECELAIKKEKEREAKAKDEHHRIKSERDIKEEKDDSKIKKEKDEKNCALKKEKDETRVKEEKYRDIKKEKDDVKIKNEKDDVKIKNEKDDVKIKNEKDDIKIKNEKYDVRIKNEKDCSRSESYSRSIKHERDSEHRSRRDRDYRNYDDVHIKRERDDHYRRSDDVRIKRERDERHRNPDDYRRGRHRSEIYDVEYDTVLKTEHVDIPYESDGDESRDSRDSYRYSESSRDRDSRSSRYDYDSASKSKRRDSRDYHSGRESHRSELTSTTRNDRVDVPVEIKTERQDNGDSRSSDYKETVRPESSTIKIERLDASVKIKTERPDGQDSQSDGDSIRSNYDSILKIEDLDIPFDIKSERCDEDFTRTSHDPEPHRAVPVRMKRPTSSSTSRPDGFPMPIPVKTEQSHDEAKTSNKSIVPLPIPIKVEKDINSDSPRPIEEAKDLRDDFPKLIKVEKEAHVDEQPSSRTQPDTHSIKHGFPMPIPIKVEKGHTSGPTPQEELPKQTDSEKGVFPMPISIKVEKDVTPSPTLEKELSTTAGSKELNFPMPIPIKIEKDETPGPAPQKELPRQIRSDKHVSMPLPIKMEQDELPRPTLQKDIPIPTIKTENPSEPNPPVQSSSRHNDLLLPIQIKVEKDVRIIKESSSTSRKRTLDFINLVDSDASSAKIKPTQIESDSESDFYSAHGMKHEDCDID